MAVKETHTFSRLSCSIHPSIPSFGQPTSASLRSLNTKKSCQSYFLVIVRPSSRSNPPSIFCSSGAFPVLPKIKRSLVAPQGECVCFECVKSKAGHVDTHMCLRVAPTLIIFKGLTSRVCDIASHQHHPTPPIPPNPASPPLPPSRDFSVRSALPIAHFPRGALDRERGKIRGREKRKYMGSKNDRKGGNTTTANKFKKRKERDEE